ncbi:MAG: helix-turn-helix transcriptional regulator, partial [Planctomycetota bacterium]|nr:helix-turn-helix transcriptional regulator [Planctomycetota bacterium]
TRDFPSEKPAPRESDRTGIFRSPADRFTTSRDGDRLEGMRPSDPMGYDAAFAVPNLDQSSRMTPRKRRELDPKSTDFTTRFALQLRKLVDKRNLTQATFLEKLLEAKLDVSEFTVKKWLSGERLARLGDLEQIATALGLKDYRDVLPPPLK